MLSLPMNRCSKSDMADVDLVVMSSRPWTMGLLTCTSHRKDDGRGGRVRQH
ncbi:hypothetical protein GW17_00062000, partial [Ensete ventricosum]